MGQDSSFYIGFEPEPTNEQNDVIMAELYRISDYPASLWEYASGTSQPNFLDQARWSSFGNDILELSALFPNLKITVFQVYEDGGQQYIYVHRGKTEYVDGVMAFPDRTLW